MKKLVVDVIDSKSFVKTFLNSMNTIDNIVRDTTTNNVSIVCGKSAVPLYNCDITRIIRDVCDSSDMSPIIRNIFLNLVHEAEFKNPGSGLIALITFIELMKLHVTSSDDNIDLINEDITKLCSKSHRTSHKSNMSYVSQFICDSRDINLLCDTLELAGSSGNINVTDGDTDNTCITYTTGYKFSIKPPEHFMKSTSYNEINLTTCKIICIDGIIEVTSEIENLMFSSYTHKIPIIIFARGFSDDVCNTLAVNYNTGYLKIIPVIVNYDDVGINQLNDIAIVSCSDVISSLKGELISSAKFDDLSIVDKINISKKTVIIHNDKAFKSSERQRSQLQSKLSDIISDISENTNNDAKEFKIKILNLRLTSLTPTCVTISFGYKDKDTVGIQKDRIRYGLTMFNTYCKYGTINLTDYDLHSMNYCLSIKNIISRLMKNKLICVSPKVMSLGIVTGLNNFNLLKNVGSWIVKDDE